jgi:hypothetical protein
MGPVLAYIPAVVGAVISVALARSGLLGVLFLLPLGILAYSYNAKTAWLSAALIIPGNSLVSLALGLSVVKDAPALFTDTVYLILMTVIFVWISAPPFGGPRFLRMQPVYRLVTGSVLASLAMALGIYASRNSQGVYARFREQANLVVEIYTSAAGTDVVQRSLSEQYLTADVILEAMTAIAIRGGLLVSCALLFFFSRQAALLVTWFARHRRPEGSVTAFHAEPGFIWVLSFSLLAALGGSWGKIALLEIVGWNVLMICAMLYLVQGVGVMIFFLTRQMSAGLRMLLHIGIFLVVISPGINVIALGALVLLGIAENWVPFRAPKPNGPSSTPGMGE